MKTGQLLVFEGADEVGKTTLAAMLAKRLKSAGSEAKYVSFPGNQIGTLGRHVNELHHEPARFRVKHLNSTSLQLLHVAAHIDSIENTIIPALQRNQTVVLDRFWWSTWIYGSIGRANEASLRLAIRAEAIHWRGIRPTRVFLIMRSAPLEPQQDLRIWKQISSAYRRFAVGERRKYPVSVIQNDSTLKNAFALVTKNIDFL